MNEDNLRKRLSKFGFDLFEPSENEDPNLVLADLVKSRDARLWEGFSVILANVAKKGLFDYRKIKGYLLKALDKSTFDNLLFMSLALYKALNLKFHWANDLLKHFSSAKVNEFNNMREKFKNDQDFKVSGLTMSTLRLKTVFNNYFNKTEGKLSEKNC